MTNRSAKTILNELQQAVMQAARNYEIWWVYKSAETRPKYLNTMNKHVVFFSTGIHAHFVAMITALYRLFETRPDTHNFSQLLAALERSNPTRTPTIQSYRDRFARLKPTWVKISKLRNSGFGHRNAEMTLDELFRDVQITPNLVRDFIVDTKALVNDVSHEFLGNVHSYRTGAREDTLSLLDALKMAYEP